MPVGLSELEMRILSELDEAGEEDVLTMLNTVIDPTGDPGELANFQQALYGLLDKKLVAIDLESMPTGAISLSREGILTEIEGLPKNFTFISEGRHWTDIREQGPPYFQTPLPRLVIAETGEALAFTILESRGYKWWRDKG
jgi:hypothetical protein